MTSRSDADSVSRAPRSDDGLAGARSARPAAAAPNADLCRAALDASPDATLVIDADARVVHASLSIKTLFDVDACEAAGQPAASFMGEPLRSLLDGLPHEGELHDHDVELPQEGGRSRWISLSIRPLRSGGAFAGRVVTARDVTARRAALLELERRNEQLEHQVNAVSHDLRSPLSSLRGFAGLLREGYGELLDDTGRRFIHRIEQASRTMETLINDLLDLARIGREVPREPVDPRALLASLEAELKPRLDALGVVLELPQSPPAVLCERTQLYQVLSNLIGNALDHMGPCREPRITVRVHEEPDAHVIEVRDNGRGIDPAFHERIFECFSKQTECGGRGRGAGLGLTIVRRIAQAHGGRVWVESRPGAGATFRFALPRP